MPTEQEFMEEHRQQRVVIDTERLRAARAAGDHERASYYADRVLYLIGKITAKEFNRT